MVSAAAAREAVVVSAVAREVVDSAVVSAREEGVSALDRWEAVVSARVVLEAHGVWEDLPCWVTSGVAAGVVVGVAAGVVALAAASENCFNVCAVVG